MQIFSRHVYDYCTNTKTQTPTSKQTIKSAQKPVGNNRQNNVADGANIVGGELYSKLKTHLKTYLEKICEVRLFI